MQCFFLGLNSTTPPAASATVAPNVTEFPLYLTLPPPQRYYADDSVVDHFKDGVHPFTFLLAVLPTCLISQMYPKPMSVEFNKYCVSTSMVYPVTAIRSTYYIPMPNLYTIDMFRLIASDSVFKTSMLRYKIDKLPKTMVITAEGERDKEATRSAMAAIQSIIKDAHTKSYTELLRYYQRRKDEIEQIFHGSDKIEDANPATWAKLANIIIT